jgi:large subunit ribosomal protein L22
MTMEARALSRFNFISARKARLVADLVRGKTVEEAVHTLSLTPKKASPMVQKTILQAVANARQLDEAAGLTDEDFVVSEIRIDEGPTQKRIRPRAQGRAYRIRKRSSHIKVIVTADESRN